MALTSAEHTASAIGQIDAAGDAQALFLKVFSGEVLTMFERQNKTLGRHMTRSIKSGKSAQFPVIGRATGEYMSRGDQLNGNTVRHAEQIVTIDNLLIAHEIVFELDEAMNHYDVRKTYSQENGRAIATQWDKHVLQIGCLAARATSPITGEAGGTTDANAGYGTTGSTIASGLYLAGQNLDENDTPEDGRMAYFKPAQYSLLVQTTDVLNRDWGGEGSYARGQVPRVDNIEIIKTNNLPSTNITADPGGTKYNGNFTNTAGLIMHGGAVGTVHLVSLKSEMQYDITRQGHWIVSKMAAGTDILRPDMAVELTTV